MKIKDIENLSMIAIGGAILYMIFKASKTVKDTIASAGQFLSNTGESIGGSVFDIFHPNAAGDLLYYTVNFPNGVRHSIASSLVDSNGQFDFVVPPYSNTRWQIVTNRQDNQHYAQEIT